MGGCGYIYRGIPHLKGEMWGTRIGLRILRSRATLPLTTKGNVSIRYPTLRKSAKDGAPSLIQGLRPGPPAHAMSTIGFQERLKTPFAKPRRMGHPH